MNETFDMQAKFNEANEYLHQGSDRNFARPRVYAHDSIKCDTKQKGLEPNGLPRNLTFSDLSLASATSVDEAVTVIEYSKFIDTTLSCHENDEQEVVLIKTKPIWCESLLRSIIRPLKEDETYRGFRDELESCDDSMSYDLRQSSIRSDSSTRRWCFGLFGLGKSEDNDIEKNTKDDLLEDWPH